MNKRISINDILAAKGKRKLACTTAYTYPVARIVSELEFDLVLVGDSLGGEILGYRSTVEVTLEDVIYHSRAVVRGNTRSYVVGDMPFLTAERSPEQALLNAGLLVQKGGVDAVKIEGGAEKRDTICKIAGAGIPVMGHIGLNPQKILKLGKYTVKGRNPEEEGTILQDAHVLEESGVFALVLECVPETLAQKITENVSVPTIGIGAGSACDGQILVCNDIFGFRTRFQPRFVKAFGDVPSEMKAALERYRDAVQNGSFPDADHSYA
jgi:3-methyl-2-oxobutanoate hydroxymethyltransferase